jgi:hypothetical protein
MSYTDKEVLALKAGEPVTFEDAVQFGIDFGKSTQSVISKVQSEEIEYIKKAVPVKKAPQATKAQLVSSIQANAGEFDLSGLTGASRDSLVGLNALLNLS